MNVPDNPYLSTQFQQVMEGAAGMGVELPENMPGMVRIGGLHVPLSSSWIGLGRGNKVPDSHMRQYDSLKLSIPDEKGNLFEVQVHPFDEHRQMSRTGFDGLGPTRNDRAGSPEEFVEMYGNAAAPDEHRKRVFAKSLDRETFTDRLMGVGPGQVWGHTTSPVTQSVEEGIHSVYDPRTGDVTGTNMTYNKAHGLWIKDWYRRQGERRGVGQVDL